MIRVIIVGQGMGKDQQLEVPTQGKENGSKFISARKIDKWIVHGVGVGFDFAQQLTDHGIAQGQIKQGCQ